MRFLSRERISQHKYKTPEGYLICVDSVLARTGKQIYRRDEVFHDSDETEIEVDRKPEEVFSEQTLASFENKPITVEHPECDVNCENYKDYSVGFVRDVKRGIADGQDVILGTLVIQDAKTIDEIEKGEHVELSCGYDCDILDEENPQQRNIRGNHVALCEQGRAGNARIVDTADDLYGLVKEPAKRYFLAKIYDEKWDIEDNIVIVAKNINEADKKLKQKYPKADKLREISHSEYLKFKQHGDIPILDSVNDSTEEDWQNALYDNKINYNFISGGYGMKFKSIFDYNKAKELARKLRYTGGHWYDKDLEYYSYGSLRIGMDDSAKDSYITLRTNDLTDAVSDIRDDAHWYTAHYNLDFDIHDAYTTIHGEKKDLQKFMNDYSLTQYNNLIKDTKEKSLKICDTELIVGKTYTTKSGNKLTIKKITSSYSDVNGDAYTKIVCDYVTTDGQHGSGEYSTNDFFHMMHDSIKDSANDTNSVAELRQILGKLSKMYSADPDISFVIGKLKSFGYDADVVKIDGWNPNRFIKGEYIKRYILETTIKGKTHHLLVELYTDDTNWKVKEINAYLTDSIKEKIQDMDYSKQSKQGFTVLEMYRDGGRYHAILKRTYDYVVALGYDIHDGTWAQGRYVNTYGHAIATLKEEKPFARKIQDEKVIDVEDGIYDVSFKYLTESEKELKEALGLYKKIEGSHTKASAGIGEKKHRQNQFNNPQVAELNEAINEAIRNLNSGVKDKSAWQRLSMKVEAWESDPEYATVAKKASAAIRKFMSYIAKDSMSVSDALNIVDMLKKLSMERCYKINDSSASNILKEIKAAYPKVITHIETHTEKSYRYVTFEFSNYPGENATGFDNDPRTAQRNNWTKFLKYLYAKYPGALQWHVRYNELVVVEKV